MPNSVDAVRFIIEAARLTEPSAAVLSRAPSRLGLGGTESSSGGVGLLMLRSKGRRGMGRCMVGPALSADMVGGSKDGQGL